MIRNSLSFLIQDVVHLGYSSQLKLLSLDVLLISRVPTCNRRPFRSLIAKICAILDAFNNFDKISVGLDGFLYFEAQVLSPEMVGAPKDPADMRGRRAERQERSRMARRAGARTLSETMHEGDGGASMRGASDGCVGGWASGCMRRGWRGGMDTE